MAFKVLCTSLLALGLCMSFATIKAHSQTVKNRFAIQNVATGKNLRPYAAGRQDGNAIILYDHHSWRCLTWELTAVGENIFTLKNRYTFKSFEPASETSNGVTLKQQPKSKEDIQWEFIKQPDGNYRIRLRGTDFYLSITSEETNSAIILTEAAYSDKQLWHMVAQDPLL